MQDTFLIRSYLDLAVSISVSGDKTSLFSLVDLLLFFSSFDFALLKFLGRVLNLYPQHGQRSPFHFMNISHCWQRLCSLL